MAHLQHKQARLMFVQLMVPVLFFIVVLIFFAWYLSPRIYLWWQMIASNTSSACGCELTPFFAFDSVFTSFLLVGSAGSSYGYCRRREYQLVIIVLFFIHSPGLFML